MRYKFKLLHKSKSQKKYEVINKTLLEYVLQENKVNIILKCP